MTFLDSNNIQPKALVACACHSVSKPISLTGVGAQGRDHCSSGAARLRDVTNEPLEE